MKWSVVGLVVVGLGAAFCAAILISRYGPAPQAAMAAKDPLKIDIVKARSALTAGSIVTADAIETLGVAAEQAPEGYVSGPGTVVGKVLNIPVVPGQVFTKNCFATDGSGARLVASLPKGMRAVGVALSDYSGVEGLLYPGCMVDVLVSFKMPVPNSTATEAISKMLLSNVEVLAIDDRTVFTGPSTISLEAANRQRRKVVTLMVDSRQAEAIQLAMEQGVISLAMRNPLDPAPSPATLTSLTNLAEEFFSRYTRPEPKLAETPATAPAAALATVAPPPKADDPPPMWEQTVIRGSTVEKRDFPQPGK